MGSAIYSNAGYIWKQYLKLFTLNNMFSAEVLKYKYNRIVWK